MIVCKILLVAKRFCHEYGCIRLSIGEAMRKVIADNPESDLTAQIISHLKKGQAVPDELCVLALERVLLNIQCSTRGYVVHVHVYINNYMYNCIYMYM